MAGRGNATEHRQHVMGLIWGASPHLGLGRSGGTRRSASIGTVYWLA